MQPCRGWSRRIGLPLLVAGCLVAARAAAESPPQYEFAAIRVPAASAAEPVRESFSAAAAVEHLEAGSVAWSGQRKCVSCHTNGTYMTIRPALAASFGPPPDDTLAFYRSALAELEALDPDALRKSTRPAQVIYLAAGFAEWDAHVARGLSPETDRALRLMLTIQEASGSWGTLDCWPPYESDAFHEATVAAVAIATAPGWLAAVATESDGAARDGVARLRDYLRDTAPPHDYGRVLLLQAATRWPGLVDDADREAIVAMIRGRQQADGGWSIRSFAAPEAWGNGGRADKLRGEPEFATPASDGHMTGLAIVVLRAAGVAADDPGVARGVGWLRTNQRESGRWWTRSLNTDSWHFITYSGTALPLLALQACDALD